MKVRCPSCNSGQVYFRVKTKVLRCVRCGKTWKKKAT